MGSIRIRVITTGNEILNLKPEEKAVHLAFRPSDRDLFNLLKRCPEVELIQLSASSFEAISKFMKMYLNSAGIHLVKGDVSGHWHDLNKYFVIPEYVLDKICELKILGRNEDEIISEVVNLRKISPELIHYLLNFSSVFPKSPGK